MTLLGSHYNKFPLLFDDLFQGLVRLLTGWARRVVRSQLADLLE